jgi:DNA-binding transcriptional MerR regulator
MTNYLSTKQAAQRVKMSVSQIHYYDQLGLIPELSRSENGYRQFSERNMIWLENLKMFIDSGMPLKKIRQLTDLVKLGKKDTIAQRRVIVEAQVSILQEKKREIDQQLDFMAHFLDEYVVLEKER